MADALATLARLRRLEADLAQRDFTDALGREERCIGDLAAARDNVQAEAARAGDVPGAFAAWLPAGLAAIATAEAALAGAVSARQGAGREAGARKAALEAVEILQGERVAASRRVVARKVQARLDEVGKKGLLFREKEAKSFSDRSA